MKALNKFLWLCFTCVVNVFYNPHGAEGLYRILSSNQPGKTSCTDATLPCVDNVQDTLNLVTQNIADTEILCDIPTYYLAGCDINKSKASELSDCISSVVGDITSLECAPCPEDGIVAKPNVLQNDTVEFWLCSDRNILLLQDGGGKVTVELNSFGSGNSYCVYYNIERWNLAGKSTVKDCYKPAKNSITGEEEVYTDEKGTFTYSEDCYIDTE